MLGLVSLLIRCYKQLIRRCFSFHSSSTLVYGFLCTCVCVCVCVHVCLCVCVFMCVVCVNSVHIFLYCM